jgi:lysozyme family protein
MGFEKSFLQILKTEGGFVDHPNDRGLTTNYGITLQTLSDYLGRQATKEEIRNISQDTVKQIYKKHYWDRLKLDLVSSDLIADFLFDYAVNRGARRAAVFIQVIVGTQQDGAIGSITLTAINERNPERLLLECIKRAQEEYVRIVENDPSQIVFLRGWLARTHKFMG